MDEFSTMIIHITVWILAYTSIRISLTMFFKNPYRKKDILWDNSNSGFWEHNKTMISMAGSVVIYLVFLLGGLYGSF